MGKFEDDLAMQANDERIQVVPRRTVHPCYMILPTFAGIGPLINDLDLPNTSDEIFCSIFVPGGDFVGVRRVKGAKHKHLQKFTVELFGLLISNEDGTRTKPKLSDPRQYACPPKYWRQSFAEFIQIWRTRVFWTVPSNFAPSPVTPVTPYKPIFPYLEERWHPQSKKPGITLGGLDSFAHGFSLLEHFYENARSILTRTHTNAGRPRVFKDTEQFIREVRDAYLAVWHEKKHEPGQKEVAEKLCCNHLTFKDYWGNDGIMPWRDLFEFWIRK